MDDKKFGNKIKEGVSVQEIEKFARKYTTEVFLILAVLIGTISSIFDFFTGARLSIIFAGLGAIASLAFPEKIKTFHKKIAKFVLKKEKTSQIIFGIIRIAIALFIPFLLFAELGLLSGLTFHSLEKESQKEEIIEPEEKKEE